MQRILIVACVLLAACGAPDVAQRATTMPNPTNIPATPGPSPTPASAYPAPYPAPVAHHESRLPPLPSNGTDVLRGR